MELLRLRTNAPPKHSKLSSDYDGDSEALASERLRHFQICTVAVLGNSLMNARCAVLFDCVRAYSK